MLTLKNHKNQKVQENQKNSKKPNNFWHKTLRVAEWVVGILIVFVVLLLGFLTITEYKPNDKIELDITGELENLEDLKNYKNGVNQGKTLTIMTWNIGYGALGDNADFFMDGGKNVNTASKLRVQENLTGISENIALINPDVIFLQEVDQDSSRSYGINEEEKLLDELDKLCDNNYISTYAYNFKVKFIPYPIPPIGKVNGGIMTLSAFPIASAQRIQLPCPFSWPVRLANLKRCLMLDRIPITDNEGNFTGKELVLINLHLEAYDTGEGKIAQTKMLSDILQVEIDNGNYVIAGGDFNQTFSNIDDSMYPEYENRWHCGELDVDWFSDDFKFFMDNSNPTCRSLDQKYNGADWDNFQYYMIDGFIVSKNISVESISTLELNFQYTDHNPVVMSVTLN